MINVGRSIRTAVDTGKVIFGERETLRAVNNKDVNLVIFASNCPTNSKEDLERHAKISKIPVYQFAGSSLELGAICGRPHLISMIGIIEAGDSDIFELGRR